MTCWKLCSMYRTYVDTPLTTNENISIQICFTKNEILFKASKTNELIHNHYIWTYISRVLQDSLSKVYNIMGNTWSYKYAWQRLQAILHIDNVTTIFFVIFWYVVKTEPASLLMTSSTRQRVILSYTTTHTLIDSCCCIRSAVVTLSPIPSDQNARAWKW